MEHSKKIIEYLSKLKGLVKLANDDSWFLILCKIFLPAFLSFSLGGIIFTTNNKLVSIEVIVLAWGIFILSLVSFALFLAVISFIAHVRDSEIHEIKIAKAIAEGKISPFADCIERVKAAKHKIFVIGSHFPDDIKVRMHEHNGYLANGIDHLLDGISKGPNRNGAFIYKRIIQIDGEMEDAFLDSASTLRRDIIGDDGLADHIKNTLLLEKKAFGKLDISINARQYMPSFPSILIIDNEHVFFSLPHNSDEGTIDQGRQDADYSIEFILHLYDKSGVTANEFELLFNQLKNQAREVKSIAE